MRRLSDFIVLAIQIALGFLFLHFAGTLTSNSFLLISGTICIVAAIGVALKAMYDLRANFAVAPSPTEESKLVTNGIYSFIRHPMYASILLACSGYLLIRYRLEMFLSFGLIVTFFTIKIKYEEKLLSRRFEDYQKYKKTSNCIFPLLRHK